MPDLPAWRGLVLFDIDGTLLRAGDRDHQAAFVAAMQQVYGVPATLDGVPLAGMLDSQIARLALARHGLTAEAIAARLPAMMALMGERYAAAVARGSRRDHVLPGVRRLAARLRAEGFALGVLTGNAEAVARAKLAAAGLADLFPVGAYGDAAWERGHLVAAAQAAAREHYGADVDGARPILVGDTPHDIAAARVAGARVLAVATGRYGVDELAAHGPDAVLPDLGDVAAALDALRAMAGPARYDRERVTPAACRRVLDLGETDR
ncbi:MAG: haloacid dehalogenase-like hydrolase [Sphaerobacter sp.]|nr:haloacid dehalogenase-like hydrolase [Sphaerobacter sp.]